MLTPQEIETAQRPPAGAVLPDAPAEPGASAAGEAGALSLTTLDRSARADVAVRETSSGARVRSRVWAEACAVSAVVSGLGVAEIGLLGMPPWLGLAFAALGCAMGADRVRLAARRAAAEVPLASVPVPSLRGGAPAALLPPPRQAREPDTVEELDRDEPEPRRPEDEDVPAAAAGVRLALPALGYTCVPPDPDGRALLSDTQEIAAWCQEAGLEVAKIVHDVEGQAEERTGGPALQWALDQVARRETDTLVVARLQNLSPTVANLPPLLRWFTQPDRRLVAIDLRLDTATEAGRLAAFALAGVGRWEKERLSARTRRGLEAARSRGAGRAGAAVADVPELRERIVRMRSEGMTLQAISDVLNAEGVPTLRGGAKWRPSSVHGATGYRRPSSARGIQVPDESPGSSTER